MKTEYDEMLNDTFEKNKVVRKVIKQRQVVKEELKLAETDVRKPFVKKQTSGLKEASEEPARPTAKITKTTSAPILTQEIPKITKKPEPTPVVRD